MVSTFSDFWGPLGLILVAAILGAIGAYWAATQQAALARELQAKTEEVVKLNERIAGLVTGGDSFCYFDVSISSSDQEVILLSAVHQGTYPVYDIHARIVDLEMLRQKIHNLTIRNVFEGDTFINIGPMPVGSAALLGDLNLRQYTKKDLNIFFSSRNQFYQQQLRLRKIADKWTWAIRVSTYNGQVLLEKIEPEFPKSELDWKSEL